MSRRSPPRVFLSYAHGIAAHEDAVLALAERLRASGIDAWIDQYESAPERGWRVWMEGEIARADYILLVCSEEYVDRLTHRASAGTGRGVRYEGTLLLDDLYAGDLVNTKLLPVVLKAADRDFVPKPLRQYQRYDVSSEEGFVALMRRLTDQPAVVAGQLGSMPVLPPLSPVALGSGKGSADAETASQPTREQPTEELTATFTVHKSERGRRLLRWQALSRTAEKPAVTIGLLGLLIAAAAWLFPLGQEPTPTPISAPTSPALYSVRVQVLDPDGRPIEGSRVRASAGNEPHLLPDGWWQIEIPAVKIPKDGKVSLWAEHARWDTAQEVLELADDPNPRMEIQLAVPETRTSGIVVDQGGRGVDGARVTARSSSADAAVTDSDGRFELISTMTQGQRVRLHVEHPEYPPRDTFCIAGQDGCSVVLRSP